MHDLCDLAHVAGWELQNLHDLEKFPGLDLYWTDLAQLLVKAGYYLDEVYTVTCPTCETPRIRYDTLRRSTARRLASIFPTWMTALRMTFCIALLNVRAVTWYISIIIIFTWNDYTIAARYTSFRLGTTTVCGYATWHSKVQV